MPVGIKIKNLKWIYYAISTYTALSNIILHTLRDLHNAYNNKPVKMWTQFVREVARDYNERRKTHLSHKIVGFLDV